MRDPAEGPAGTQHPAPKNKPVLPCGDTDTVRGGSAHHPQRPRPYPPDTVLPSLACPAPPPPFFARLTWPHERGDSATTHVQPTGKVGVARRCGESGAATAHPSSGPNSGGGGGSSESQRRQSRWRRWRGSEPVEAVEAPSERAPPLSHAPPPTRLPVSAGWGRGSRGGGRQFPLARRVGRSGECGEGGPVVRAGT